MTDLSPDTIFCLVGAVSADEDRMFLSQIRQILPEATVIGCGDTLLTNGNKWIEQGLLDAVALDFTTEAFARYAEGDRNRLPELLYRHDGRVVKGPPLADQIVRVGKPPHHLFISYDYRFPFTRKKPFASLLVDYGCPFNCSFCVMSGLNYHRRPLSEVAAELDALKSMGIQEFILWDQTFAAKRAWAMEFLELLPVGEDKFGWTCYTRPDKIDRPLAMEMARHGCHTAIMGIETANNDTLKALRKGFTTKDTLRAFAVCREAGITTVGTAIVGLPGETQDDVLRSIDFVCRVDPDYLSVHTAVPRSGTRLRESMVEQGLVEDSLEKMDQCGENEVLSSDSLSSYQIKSLHRRFTLRFYLRPRYLLRTAVRLLSTPSLMLEHARQGLVLMLKNTARRR
ncbi:MAG: radical SAM protein [Pseudomonadota bacterium]